MTDRGPGIAREHLPRLTERFYRVEGQKSGDRSGTGLGLALSRQLAELLGGRVELQSVPGELREMMGLDSREGVLVGQVAPASTASEAGLSPGDVLLAVEREAVRNADDASARITRWLKTRKSPDPLLLLVQRGPGDRIFVALEVK